MPRPVPLRTVHCGPCWAAHGGRAAAADIAPPPAQALQTRDPAGQYEWLHALAEEPWVARLQARTRTRLMALAWRLAAHAGWDSWETWPTWARLQAHTGWSRSTVAVWLRQLRIFGWLAHLEHGSTDRFRPMGSPERGNRAAVYALRVPLRPSDPAAEPSHAHASAGPHNPTQNPAADTADDLPSSQVTALVDKNRTPTTPFDDLSLRGSVGTSRAREVFHNLASWRAAEEQIEALRARAEEGKERELDFCTRVPQGAAQMLAAAAQLAREDPILARLSPKAIRAECRPYWAAGWTGRDVLHALTYRPTSWSTLPSSADYAVIRPAGWVRSRLAAWRYESGRILAGHSQQPAIKEVIRARHGRGALNALPGGARTLTGADLRAYADQRSAAAAETLARRRRGEAADARSAPRPPEQAAGDAARAAAQEQFRRDQQRRDTAPARSPLHEQLVEQARAHLAGNCRGPHPPESGKSGEAPPHGDSPGQRYQRALARARQERRDQRTHWPRGRHD